MKDCNQCGKCCIKYGDGGLSASAQDIEGWEYFRPDIFEYVRGSEIWFDPQTGNELNICPWLEKDESQKKYTCAIYLDRPEDCRHYPTSIDEMVRDECEMIEVIDLKNTHKSQKELDRIMSDSRPPFLS